MIKQVYFYLRVSQVLFVFNKVLPLYNVDNGLLHNLERPFTGVINTSNEQA